jgi:hypothetical protein
MAKRQYPRIGKIEKVKPQGLCFLCDTVMLNGKRPEKRIHVEYDYFRGNDDVFKAHGECIDVLVDGKSTKNAVKLLDRLINWQNH